MHFKVLSLAFSIFMSLVSGEDPINDPYEAAIVAAEVTGLNDTVTGRGHNGKHGASWLIGSAMAGTRLSDFRDSKRKVYAGTAIHGRDAAYGKSKYRVGVKRGWLRPDTCVYHVDDGSTNVRGEKPYARWSTSGPYDADIYNKFKLMSQYTGTDCFPPAYFDIPLFSALAASEFAIKICKRHGRGSRSKPCDKEFLRCIWAGIGKCQDPDVRANVERRFVKWNRRARRRMREEGDLPPLPASWTNKPVDDQWTCALEDVDCDDLGVPPPRPPEM